MIAPLLAALLLSGGPGTPPTTPEGPRSIPCASARRSRAEALLRSGEEGARQVLAEAVDGPAAARRAALEALGTLAPGDAPAGTLEAALPALASDDPALRAAAVHALGAVGEGARAALEPLASAVPRALLRGCPVSLCLRAGEALHDLKRGDVEREFLDSWSADDGTYFGMFASLRRHGAFGARVLAAVALDRRMAGAGLLGYGPYSWLTPPESSRERSEIRERALQALRDAGDAEARERLRALLRARPADELYDETDEDPIPAQLDDAVRQTIASLGDPGPLLELIRASGSAPHGRWATTVEMHRIASAHAVLGEAATDPDEREAHLDEAISLQEASLRQKEMFGIAVDGVEYYNLACALSRRNGPGDRAEALTKLRRSVRTYAVDSKWVLKDGDLANLRGDPRFEEIVETLRRREERLREGLPK